MIEKKRLVGDGKEVVFFEDDFSSGDLGKWVSGLTNNAEVVNDDGVNVLSIGSNGQVGVQIVGPVKETCFLVVKFSFMLENESDSFSSRVTYHSLFDVFDENEINTNNYSLEAGKWYTAYLPAGCAADNSDSLFNFFLLVKDNGESRIRFRDVSLLTLGAYQEVTFTDDSWKNKFTSNEKLNYATDGSGVLTVTGSGDVPLPSSGNDDGLLVLDKKESIPAGSSVVSSYIGFPIYHIDSATTNDSSSLGMALPLKMSSSDDSSYRKDIVSSGGDDIYSPPLSGSLKDQVFVVTLEAQKVIESQNDAFTMKISKYSFFRAKRSVTNITY